MANLFVADPHITRGRSDRGREDKTHYAVVAGAVSEIPIQNAPRISKRGASRIENGQMEKPVVPAGGGAVQTLPVLSPM